MAALPHVVRRTCNQKRYLEPGYCARHLHPDRRGLCCVPKPKQHGLLYVWPGFVCGLSQFGCVLDSPMRINDERASALRHESKTGITHNNAASTSEENGQGYLNEGSRANPSESLFPWEGATAWSACC
jgi:hypothetical protein